MVTELNDSVAEFYQRNLVNARGEKKHLTADCPFCHERGFDPHDRLVVFLKKSGFFHGYFRCLNNCVPGGFPLWFAKLSGIDLAKVPGYDPDREPILSTADYPSANRNLEIQSYEGNFTEPLLDRFSEKGIGQDALSQLHVGFNGRYIVFPYFQEDGNCYAARCVFPDRQDDYFWHGNEQFFSEEYQIFNVEDINRCENGSLFLCEGEETLLALKQLGYPAVAVPDSHVLESIDPQRFAFIKTLFLVTSNSAEAEASMRKLAARIGYKVRPFRWPVGLAKDYTLCQLAKDKGKQFRAAVSALIQGARAFSPFTTPSREYAHFQEQLSMEGGSSYMALRTGFPLFDDALDGVHGINVVGGAPKSGKSTFLIQIATDMALRNIPVLYYDFENGRQKLYHRTLCRLSQLSSEAIRKGSFSPDEAARYRGACERLQEMLQFFRVINDRQVTPEIMRRHIDFIHHETHSDYTIVVIDSLHKLPFKDFSERRTGIDAWLRQMESIRDELNVSFLVISELSRGDGKSYKETPHLGVFKGSGDIEYSADNAMVLYPDWDPLSSVTEQRRRNKLWLVASREHSPGLIAEYEVDYPYWGFIERQSGGKYNE
ncbi:replicative DNA helicase [Desulfocapsa sulfexigens DSM 10523]|uniref:Replicative DNA helicase n=1 Tax=Desulfocapsa sulfexigens (strain DSM 10523 / SB164P1) TaxID=1167006 RepID=M1PJG0_DESSD|nr:bifunctional DNA primase/helicase [Desulfocapsa sulfexigens]AGF76636.1 replicative DNA helicase [Desulfocapsa sulfexigens DSM 10523]